MRPELFIEIIRDSNDNAVKTYTEGGCYKFFKILEAKYPGAEAYYDGNHVITKIDGDYYDVTGKVSKTNHLRMTQEEQDNAETWKKDTIMADTLNEKNIKEISQLLGISDEKLKDALTKEDVSLQLPEGDFFTEDQLSKRDSSKYNEGKEAGKEMLVKDAKKKMGYEFEGKSIEDLLNHHEKEIESVSKRDKSEWQKDFENQKIAYETDLQKEREEKQSYLTKLKKQELNNELLSLMPKETTISKKAIMTLFNAEYGTDEQDGIKYITRGGERLKDPKSTEPIALEKVFNDFVVKEGYVKAPNGRGGDNNSGAGNNTYASKTPESFEKEWKAKNPDKETTSPQYMKDYAEFRNQQKSA